jgi:hypothetical protein
MVDVNFLVTDSAVEAACFDGFPQMFGCAGNLVFGSAELASIAFFLIAVYVMYRAGMNTSTSVTLGLMLFYAIYWITKVQTFADMILLAILGVGIVFGIVFIRHFTK